jgi:hypothetical protein
MCRGYTECARCGTPNDGFHGRAEIFLQYAFYGGDVSKIGSDHIKGHFKCTIRLCVVGSIAEVCGS